MRRALGFHALLFAAACNAPAPPESTGGTDIEPGPCGRGYVVVNTDYQSTNVSLLAVDGRVLSSSFISSATAGATASLELGGDVVMPSELAAGPEIVLIDRHPASVLTWVDVATARVERQLSVKTGTGGNPHDYVRLSDERALVTRFDPNLSAGASALDSGNDVVVLDPRVPEATASIRLDGAMAGEDPALYARPSRAVRVGERVLVLLQAYSFDFDRSAASRVAALDAASGELGAVRVLDGLHGCQGFALSPSGGALAVACSGRFDGDSAATLEESGIVVLDTSAGLAETARFSAAEIAGRPLGFGLAWATETTLVVTSFGSTGENAPAQPDAVVELALGTGAAREILRSNQQAFVLGDVSCAAGCGTCLVTDAERGVVHRFSVVDDRLDGGEPLVIDDRIGLPPRTLGRF